MRRPQRIITAFLICAGFALSFAGKTFAEDITISSDTTWQPGAYTYDNVLVTNGAILVFNGAVTLNAQNLTVDSGASLSSDGKGYPFGQGPGAGLRYGGAGGSIGGGAGYGGKGGGIRRFDGVNTGGDIYGSGVTPVDLGSGGWHIRFGGSGGGAIRITVSDTLIVNGNITANGSDGKGQISSIGSDYNQYGGGGSGGSIYLTSQNIAGSGSIAADGGNGGLMIGGGGGGGRIAVYYHASSFAGAIQAKGGTGGIGNGEDGTVIFQPPSSDPSNTIININTRWEPGIYTYDNVWITNGATLTFKGTVTLQAKNLTIDSGSFISANERGYKGGTGNTPGEGPGGGKNSGQFAGGGGYGGRGGGEYPFGHIPLGGSTYGSAIAPVDLGSGGGGTTEPNWGFQSTGGDGGGAIKLVISDTLTLNGSITANGMSGGSFGGSNIPSGGSGGSVYIITSSLTGTGLITANGGEGGGGGGRIAVYYKTSSFTGRIEARGKGGEVLFPAEDGTVITVSDFPVSFFTLIETSSTTATSQETLSTQAITLNNLQVSGDLTGTLNFTKLTLTTLSSGVFSGKGFLEAEFETTLEGASYQGNLQGVVYPDPKENKVHLKASISGFLINGIAEAALTESIPGSGVYDKYQATWKLNRLGTDIISASINLEGTVSSQLSYSFTSMVYTYQGNFEGDALGSYSGPLSAVLTHLRLTGESEYKGKGFSLLSYNSLLGQGEGYSYNQVVSEGIIDFQGLLHSPLLGKLQATLDETKNPKTFSGTIERLDLGTTPAPDLKVNVWGPTRVSPGRTFDYIIEYRNDGLKLAEDVAIFNILDPIFEYISASTSAYYNNVMDTVNWGLGNISAKAKGYLSVRTKLPWGLQQGINLTNSAYIADVSLQGPEIVPQPCQTNLFLNGIGYQGNDKVYEKKCREFALDRNATWIEVYKDLGNNKLSALYNGAMDTLDALHDIATDTNGLRNPEIVGGRCYNTCYAYSGGTATVITAIINHNLKCNNLELISPFSTGRTADEGFALFKRDLELHLMGRGEVKNITIYQGQNDHLFDIRNIFPLLPPISLPTGIIHPKFPEGESMQGVKIVRNDTVRHVEWLQYLNNRDKPDTQSIWIQQIIAAFDPNELLVSPEGDVKPGDKLNYTINYENEGEGDAYGVYITDTLEEDLDDTTLIVNNSGKYNPATRTIIWFIGELLSKQKGSVTFSVNVKSDAQDGSEVINFATVYFPSVPEITRTNGTVNGITTYIDNVAPVTTAAVLPLPNSAGWNNSDVTVTLSAVDNEGGSGLSKTEYSLDNTNWTIYTSPFIIATEGTTIVYYKSTDNLNNAESAKSLELKIDKTPPTITSLTTPQPNFFGWNNSEVTVSFTAADTLSGVAISTQPQTIITEGKDQIIGGQAVDIAGNSATTEVSINLDKTPPTITATSSPQPNSAGWNNSDVTVSFAGEDSLSGIKTLTAPIVVTTEGQAQEKIGEAIDFADNQASASLTLNIDKTPPEVLLELKPINLSEKDEKEDEGNWYELVYSAQDNLSGLKDLQAGLTVISLVGFKQEFEVDKELEIKIDEKKKKIKIEGLNPQSILDDLKDLLFNLNTNQILQLKVKQGESKWKIKEKHQGIEIQAPSCIFKAIAFDNAGNQAVKELEFSKDKEREDNE